MNKLVLSTIVSVVVVLPGPALAQAQASKSADDYVCQFTGNCSDEPEVTEETLPAPETKGFSLGRMSAQYTGPAAPVRERVPPSPNRVSKVAVPGQRLASKVSNVKSAPKQRVAMAQPRGDLSLSFELGSAVLTDTARANAAQFAKALLLPELVGRTVLIEGHTDRQGSRAYNLDLSQRRAEAVADLLKAQGVPAERLRVKGYGFDKPVSKSAERNRRVEAVLGT